MEDKQKSKRISVPLSEDLYKTVRHLAIDRNTTIGEIARVALLEKLAREDVEIGSDRR